MRNLKITRKKSIFGMLIPYDCIIGIRQIDVFEGDPKYPIWNGETIDIPIPECTCCVVIHGKALNGEFFSNPVQIEEGTKDVAFKLITKYDWIRGSSYELVRNY